MKALKTESLVSRMGTVADYLFAYDIRNLLFRTA